MPGFGALGAFASCAGGAGGMVALCSWDGCPVPPGGGTGRIDLGARVSARCSGNDDGGDADDGEQREDEAE